MKNQLGIDYEKIIVGWSLQGENLQLFLEIPMKLLYI